jgi:hypothetical protein
LSGIDILSGATDLRWYSIVRRDGVDMPEYAKLSRMGDLSGYSDLLRCRYNVRGNADLPFGDDLQYIVYVHWFLDLSGDSDLRRIYHVRHWSNVREQSDLSGHSDVRSDDNLRYRHDDLYGWSDLHSLTTDL